MTIPPNSGYRTIHITIQQPVPGQNPDEPLVMRSVTQELNIPVTSGASTDTVELTGNKPEEDTPSERPSSSSYTIKINESKSPKGKNRLGILTDSMIDKLRKLVDKGVSDKTLDVLAGMLKVTREELLERIGRGDDEVSAEEETEETEEETEETSEKDAQIDVFSGERSSFSYTIETQKSESSESKDGIDILTDSMIDKLRKLVDKGVSDKTLDVLAGMLKVTREELLERIGRSDDEVSAEEETEEESEKPVEKKDTRTRLLEKIAEKLGISVEELLERGKAKPKEEPKEPAEPIEAKDIKTRLLERIAQLREKNVEDSKEKDKPEEKTAEKPEESSWTSRLYEAIAKKLGISVEELRSRHSTKSKEDLLSDKEVLKLMEQTMNNMKKENEAKAQEYLREIFFKKNES